MTDSDDTVLSWGDIYLRQSDFALLDEGQWLNDALIEWFFEYLERCVFPKSQNFLLLRPAIVQLMVQSVESVQALKPCLPARLDEKELLFIPVNDGNGAVGGGAHWSLLIYDKDSSTFYYFDSYHDLNLKAAKRTAKEVHRYVHNNAENAYNFVSCETPQQSNGFDCGVFVCAITNQIAKMFVAQNMKEMVGVDRATFSQLIAQEDTLITMQGAEFTSNLRQDMKRLIMDLAEETQKQPSP